MLEHVPQVIGEALRGLRPGLETLTANRDFGAVPATLTVTSPAFAGGGALPVDATADGAGLSPAIAWQGVPAAAAEIVVVIEDADSPTPAPLVHLILYGLPGRDGAIAAGELNGPADAAPTHRLGKSSFLKAAYLPPDPPTGHGPHRYAVQVFALDAATALDPEPGRGAVVAAMTGHVIAKGLLIGTYERR